MTDRRLITQRTREQDEADGVDIFGAPLTDGGMASTSAVSPSVSGSVLDEQGLIPGGSPACHAGAHDEVATGKGLAASIEPLQLSIGEAA